MLCEFFFKLFEEEGEEKLLLYFRRHVSKPRVGEWGHNVCGSGDLCALPQSRNQETSLLVEGWILLMPAGICEVLKSETSMQASKLLM